MISIALLLFLIFVCSCFWYYHKNIANFMSIYCIFWIIVILLAKIKLFGMMSYSNKPFYLILIGTVGMIIGYIANYCLKDEKLNSNKYTKKFFNEKTIMIMSCVSIFFYAMQGAKLVKLLLSGNSYYYIRRMYQGYENVSFFTSNIESYFSSYISVPFIFIITGYITVSIFKKQKNKKTLIVAIIAEILYLVVSASRFILFQLIYNAIYLFIFQKKQIPKKFKKYIKKIVVVLVILILVVTSLRENRVNGKTYEWGTIKGAYSYYSISIPLMDYWTNYIDRAGFQSFGITFFRAPLNILNLLVLQPIGINFKILNESIDMINITDEFIQVFPKHKYNAFATIFYYFYMDYREAGIFFGFMILGFLCAKIYRRANILCDDKGLMLSLLVVQIIAKTLVRWELSSPSFFVAFILAHFIYKKKEGKYDGT